MNVVVGLILVVALTTLVKLGTRRLFRRGAPTTAADERVKPTIVTAKSNPKPTARTNGSGRRRR